MAQEPAPAAPAGQPSPEQMAELQTMQGDIESLSLELQSIQQAAFEADPSLVEEQDRFRKLILDQMDEQGANVDETVASIRADQAALQGEELDEAARQETMARMQANSESLQVAHMEALQAPAVVEANAALEQKIIAAMTAQDPRTEELIGKLDAAHDAYNARLQSFMAAPAE